MSTEKHTDTGRQPTWLDRIRALRMPSSALVKESAANARDIVRAEAKEAVKDTARNARSTAAALAHPAQTRDRLYTEYLAGQLLIDRDDTSYNPTVRGELKRLLSRPLPVETQTLICNAILAFLWWAILPADWRTWFFGNLYGPAGFAMVVVGYMVADVTSTNIFGHDPSQALKALKSPNRNAIRRFIYVKAAAIGILTGLTGCAVALVLNLLGHGDLRHSAMTFTAFFVIPAITLSLGSIIGILFPYQLRGAAWRWERRHKVRMNVRWAVLCFGPGLVLVSVLLALMYPALAISDWILPPVAAAEGNKPSHSPYRPLVFALTMWVYGALSLKIFTRITARIAEARRAYLIQYLTDEETG
ncbi:MAG: hypothetical protein Q4P78_02530 [Rothia sp. (in: high G+C Gram-positive bacteria)]|uniref:hypothetical protein n=1 Tax=Rothia sp. (in: high G+C Gram-positive bacteria) TaxID=1885016 RepID=UPI0026DF0089|nr:hypothetical protein [Rothia sp. (in: high G+C Gram-positive bacteria)]MDO5750064.1 hypothetical protein [Rothia sp. (in: high G+C Gram-positive bacteria)]